ncbi:GNAT family N-acetyltransferase [Vreelandella titanicae]|uniref:Mycothiol acetyltransferase n=1 Tax=Vreelandella titanicae TaxID=664683 RepID=A0AAP9NM79_9GAMM|nr:MULTISPECIES: GNAT family N-acetyltransferase [Halomonas]NAO95257.1 GNAT family N-acetyltransferase [Halomonas sp. MG34]QGQ72145.1 GNAT family N-acetyltransferase [Halomonas sp. PA16-9]UEQ02658.1 GNAT family N-acetyltransferase [Halomonas profundus]PKH60755.1 N-acetyltransferase [Halomonas sp. Choline-3u-9]QKS24428.1 Mycothiol acetyltransferase [Halomonas titanicae]|tara:strand:+ start:3329 stop:3820 length:492 start_codon:yes stop_codon:yes gene_type:complete
MIRVFEDQDFEAIEEIYTLAKLDEFRFERGPFELIPLRQDEERLRGLMESVIFVYADKGIRGYGAVYENEIRTLLVHPLFRRQGVGNQLFGHMIAWIGRPVTLCVARSNVAAKALYQQYGFKVTEEFEACYNGKPVLANKMEQSSTIFGKSSADTAFSRSRTR